ncbi:DNA/RNA helicase domain-containing protein [Streptomyces sp. NPDC127077]|uniref:DNA/RNA helicase domain-containing protein n=1 Tax=Streptomyces sp. NPDC127077 TaxID=3347131 RepID=UPI0036498FDA
MYLYGGRVADAASQVVRAEFISAAEQNLRRTFGITPEPQEIQAWRHSWPALLNALMAAGLGGLQVFLEYALPATGERIDALIVGESDTGQLCTVAVELKQWTHAQTRESTPGLVRAGKRTVQHPARQVGGYVHYLQDWVSHDDFPLTVRGVAVLHDAPSELIDTLRSLSAIGPSAAFAVLGRDDLTPAPSAQALAQRLACHDLQPAATSRIEAFLKIEHRPSPALLARAGQVIEGHDAFTLIGDQDTARQEVLHAVTCAEKGEGKSLIVVSGGPGTGKTVIACRLLGDLCARPGSNPRLLSPSGTLTRQLKRTIGPESRGLIATFLDKIPAGVKADSVVLLDEAHRTRTYPGRQRPGFPITLGKLINQAAVTVLFLDEQQIIRPTEGITLHDLRQYAQDQGMTFIHTDLTTQFRCNGSRAYQQWINHLFCPEGDAPAWTGTDYDAALSHNPDQFTDWINTHTQAGHTARITAGYCWSWESPDTPPLKPEVELSWNDGSQQHSWIRPWNARSDDASFDHPDVPARPYWATDPGGHHQVGCVYTAQGMEYPYNVVILGDDLTRRDNRWVARPQASEDSQLNELPPHLYLRYALNIYRVLATRGSRGTRFYSTDPDTQTYLQTLLPQAR